MTKVHSAQVSDFRPGDSRGRRRGTSRRGDRGSTTLEAAIVIPVLLSIILLIVAVGRIALAQSAVTSAAAAASRAASLARTPREAQQDAQAVTNQTLQQKGLKCTPSVNTDVSGFGTPLGTSAQVQSTVTCTVGLGDLLFPGLPGSKTIKESSTSVLDSYRER